MFDTNIYITLMANACVLWIGATNEQKRKKNSKTKIDVKKNRCEKNQKQYIIHHKFYILYKHKANCDQQTHTHTRIHIREHFQPYECDCEYDTC